MWSGCHQGGHQTHGDPFSRGHHRLLTWQIFCEKLSTSSFRSCLSCESCSCSPRRLSLASDSTSCSSFICKGTRGTVGAQRAGGRAQHPLPSSTALPLSCSPGSPTEGPCMAPRSCWEVAPYLGGVGVVLVGPAGFVAPGMRGVRVLGVGDAVRVGVPKIRLLHAWAS